jgi:DNA-directed RNA polymerase subunit F
LQIRELLAKGDRRQILGVDKVLAILNKNPNKFSEVFALMSDKNPLVKMRAADVVEKFSKQHPTCLQGLEDKIIKLLHTETQQEVCWHLAQIMPRLKLDARQQKLVYIILESYLQHKSNIVQVFALEALVKINHKASLKFVQDKIKHGSPAVQNKANKLLKLL